VIWENNMTLFIYTENNVMLFIFKGGKVRPICKKNDKGEFLYKKT